MGPQDEVLWNRFIDKHPKRFIKCFYDFQVGEPGEAIPEMPHNLMMGWQDLTRWRVDVVAEDDEKIYIIEVKPNANANAFGKALGYSILWRFKHPNTKEPVPVILTDEIVKSTKLICDFVGVELWTPEQNNGLSF